MKYGISLITSSLMILPSGLMKYGLCFATHMKEKPSRRHLRPKDMRGGESGRTYTLMSYPISLMFKSKVVLVVTVPLAVRKSIGALDVLILRGSLEASFLEARSWLAPESTIQRMTGSPG